MSSHSLASSSALSMAMVAGEVSGDLLASLLIAGLQKHHEGVRLFGIGGERMKALGFHAQWSSERLAVRGYFEVLKHYRGIVAIRDAFKAQCLRERPDVFIGVDAPDFNLDLARSLKTQGIPTVQFVCPSVWAWRAHRLVKMAQSVDHVLCIFPFEVELLRAHGIQATFVGHPLAQSIELDPPSEPARSTLGLSKDSPVVALMPGSRDSEVKHLADRFLLAAREMLKSEAGLQFVLPTPASFVPWIQQRVEHWGLQEKVQVHAGNSHAVLASCDVALIASGTATLEAALFKKPMVIAYHMNILSWWIMDRQRLQPWVGLPNILAQEFLVPELLQDKASPKGLAHATLSWLRNDSARAQLKQKFTQLHQSLIQDTPQLCVQAIDQLLRQKGHA